MGVIQKWLNKFRLKVEELRHLEDGPHRIALGVGIGSLIGFLPPLGFKTLLAMGVAKLFRGNVIAAAIGVILHNIVLPLGPLILYWEYKLGVLILGRSGELGGLDEIMSMSLGELFQWSVFVSYQVPLLIGGFLVGIPFGLLGYYLTWRMFRLNEGEE